MKILNLIREFNEIDINLHLVDDKLEVDAPKGVLTSELLNLIKENEKGIIQYLLLEEKRSDYISIKCCEKKEYYNLSSAQKRIYILQQLDVNNIQYNFSMRIPLGYDTNVNTGQVLKIFEMLADYHECLRTSFHMIDDIPVQKVHEHIQLRIEYFKVKKGDLLRTTRKFIKPFELNKVPLIRIGLVEEAKKGKLLLIDIHHILMDGISQVILKRDIFTLFSGEELPRQRIQYKDYSEWLNSKTQKDLIVKQKEYWLNEFSDDIPILDLPTDYPRPIIQSFAGARMSFFIDEGKTKALKEICNQNSVTLFMTLLSQFCILMHKLSGQTDIVIGAPIAGRMYDDLQNIMGNLVNTLPIRIRVICDMSFESILKHVREKALTAYENQEYQFEDIVENVAVGRDTSRNPLFDVMFTLQNQEEFRAELSDYNDEIILERDTEVSRFDIVLICVEVDRHIFGTIEYCTDLFKHETIEKFIRYFKIIISTIVDNTTIALSEIKILSEAEEHKILYEFNDTQREYSRDSTIPDLFEEQVNKRPGNIAIVFQDEQLTYSELNKQSNQLSRLLVQKGIKFSRIAGIMTDRSIYLIIGILGILKAGGVYLPIDPGYPVKRIEYMLNDSDALFLLVDADNHKKYSSMAAQGQTSIKIQPHLTAPRPQIIDLDSLPFPDRSLVNYEKFSRFIGLALVKNNMTLQATRGCPYHCAFCHKLWPKSHVRRSAENIFKEVKLYYDLGVRRFSFVDDIFNLDRENSTRFFRLIIENGLDVQIFFPAGVRGDILTKEYIDLMVKAGTTSIGLSLETASPRLQKLIGKNLNIEKLRENIEYIAAAYPHVILEFFTMLGFPTETEEEALMTLDFIKSIKWIDFPIVSILKIYPNTDMEKLALEHGISSNAIFRSQGLAFHELPETLPFDKSFALKFQADFLNSYFLLKERLLQVLPNQMKRLTEDEIVQKYNSYLPVDITCFADLLDFAGITMDELGVSGFYDESRVFVPALNEKIKHAFSPGDEPLSSALRILLLDLSQFFTGDCKMLYDVVEAPLGLLNILTYLKHEFGNLVTGKIAKSRIDFDSYTELKLLMEEFKPDVIGIRTLSFYKDFFHKVIAEIRNWGFDVPIITGGPYATSDYKNILQDCNVDLVVFGEGEITFNEVIDAILKNGGKYPGEEVLERIYGIAYVPKNSAAERDARQIIMLYTYEDDILELPESANIKPVNFPNGLAYVMYTSGSTGEPKGVMVEHRNVIRLVKNSGYVELNENTRLLLTGAPIFDATTFEIWGSLLNGGRLYLVEDDTLLDAYGLGQELWKNNINTLWLTAPLFNQLFQQNSDMFARLSYLLVGGDVLTPKYINSVRENNRELKVINGYGPTENTTFSACFSVDKNYEDKIPIGKPIGNSTAYILDGSGKLQPIMVEGELCFGGDGVSRGYMNNPELTHERFIPDFFNKNKCGSSHDCWGRIYRSGDQARWLDDGNIEFLGRRDHQVKIRGFRVEAKEIEACIHKIEGIKEAIVVAREDKFGDKNFCSYVVFDKSQVKASSIRNVTDIRNILVVNLPDYMIPSYFVELDNIPLTANGKVDRKLLPEPKITVTDGYDAPRNKLDSKIANIWSQVLEIDKGNISISANFFDLGGNSIKTIQIISRINKELELEIKFRDFIQLATIANLSDFILKNENVKKNIMYPLKSPDLENIHAPFPLTEVQLAYLMGRNSQFELGGVSTHGYFELSTPISIELLNDSLNKLIRRHAMLRAIIMENGQQRILEGITGYEIKIEDLRDMSAEEQLERIKVERERMSQDTFKPDQWPLFEIVAFKLPGDISYFCIGFDPLISDGTSIDIIFSEIIKFNENPELELPELEFSFRDYMLALQELRISEIYKRDKKYWLGKLAGFPPFPALPLKSDPLQVVKPIFKLHRKIIPKALWRRLKSCARKKNITSSALLCTIYAEILAYWSNQPRLAVNLTVFNRYPFHEDVEKIVGDFTSLILLEIDLEPGTSFWDRAKKVQETIWDALEHRHYDGLEFMRELGKRDNIKNRAVMPIVFTSMLANESVDEEGDSENGSLQEESLDNESQQKGFSTSQTSQVYIDYSVREAMGNLYVNWAYVENLFDPEVIDSMFAQNIMKITKLAQGEDVSISRLIYEGISIFDRYNSTDAEIRPALLHRLFSEQVERTPDNIAVEMGSKRLSYKELDEKSNQVARYLQEHGVKRSDLVGIITSRDIDTIVNVMGVLKSGGAYVPIDSEYPAERRNYIYNNSHCNLLLQENLYEVENLSRYSVEEVAVINKPEDIAYVIFTSGSTGRPKGVIITHRSASNTIIDINQKFSVGPEDWILGISSMCFDLSVYDVFGALSVGAVLVLIKDQRDLDLLIDAVKEHKITIWNSVPAIMDMLVNHLDDGKMSRGKGEGKIFHKDDDEEIYYWSPAVFWNKTPDTIKIGGVACPDIAMVIFPELYFLTQKGIAIKEIINAFPAVDREVLENFIWELVDNRVLVNSILTPWEVFAPQKELFTNEYSEEILVNPVEYDKFKRKQLARRPTINSRNCISLGVDWELPSYIRDRRSYRDFEEKRKIPFHVFSKLLSVFKQTQRNDSTHYYYASAGGLYPIDIYIYIKKGRVENMDGGLYYYSPVDHTLNLLDEDAVITESAHYPGNKTIFNSSALSVFMIYNAGVTMPRYGGLGYFMAAIDSGIMVAALTQVCELLAIGLCSIGDMHFDKIKSYFNLDKNQVFIHAVELGLKPGAAEISAMDIPVKGGEPLAPGNDDVPWDKIKLKTVPTGFEFLRVVLLSGDWIPLPLPEKIKRYFPNAEVISLGGATEGSIWSIYYPVKEVTKHWKSIPYGYPLANQRFYVLNYELELCPIGVKGELYIGGVGVAEGYANDIIQTRSSFIQHPVLGRIYRTGDYGVFHKEGYIEFLGRKDHQVKIRGYRIELGEIETCLLQHHTVRNAVVIDRIDSAGKKYLCAYLVADEKLPVSQLRSFLSGKLPDYMFPSYFVYLDSIPLTPNGKVERNALPTPELKLDEGYTAPRDEMEIKIVDIWSEVLYESSRESSLSIGIDDDFFELGGNSVKAILMILKLHKELNVKVSVAEIFRSPNVRELSEYIRKTVKDKFTAIKPSEKKEYYPLSSAQKRFYILQHIGENNIALNLPQVMALSQDINMERLEGTFKESIKRHESLRTSFLKIDGMPVQKIHEGFHFSVEYFKLGEKQEVLEYKNFTGEDDGVVEESIKNFVRPFDLSKPPLLRVRLVRSIDNRQILLMDMHHIISDRISLTILEQEFRSIYSGHELEPLKLQYRDFVKWQNNQEKQESIKRQELYWLTFFSEGIPILDFPTDYSGSVQHNYEGDEYSFGLNKELTTKLKSEIPGKDVTLFMMLIAAYYVLLSRLSGKDDIIIGVPVPGRSHDDLRNLIGMFVNIVAIRNRPRKSVTFAEFLEEVKQNSLAAFSNQDFQFELIFDKLKLDRDLTRYPLFNTVFNMPDMGKIESKSIPITKSKLEDLSDLNKKTSRYDINIYALDLGERIEFICTYRTCLFKRPTIEYIMGEYIKLIEQVLENHHKLLKDYKIFL